MLGIWFAVRQSASLRKFSGTGWPSVEIDDDKAAELIGRYRPALMQALAKPA
jgi:hypothetical protein